MARAIVKVLHINKWYHASLITEDDYANDGFVETFMQLTGGDDWRIEDHIRLPRHLPNTQIDYRLLNLLENKSRVIILHCSVLLAGRVFQVARQEGFTRAGYAWFVTQDVVTHTRSHLHHYPVGLLAVTIDHGLNPNVISDAVSLVAKATARYVDEQGLGSLQGITNKHPWWMPPSRGQLREATTLYRYLKNTTVTSSKGKISFDADGVRKNYDFRLLNLVQRTDGLKRWKGVGYNKNGTFKISTIIWPGKTMSAPLPMGERTLRVVTNIVQPFVMEQDAIEERCTTSAYCLRVQTKDKEALDDIFKDFSRRVHNKSRPYTIRCCQGLSIMLLQRLARDLNFTIQLYITADEKYGNLENGSWNGLVQDLMLGAAHMAVAAFSVTRSRSRVIDFTHPYFYSGYSILVAESTRSPPIYAFMEPFDGWVWISIVISATVVAVALSLLEWHSPFGLNPWGRKRKTNYTLGSGLNMVYAILFQHTIKTKSPKAWPSKWLQNFWAGVSIFIYSSYTANLAAFLAGKNSGVIITGIHDPKLLENRVGYLRSSSISKFLVRQNMQVFLSARRNAQNFSIEGIQLVLNSTLDAYLDDTPVLEYARTNLDVDCKLRVVGMGFGEDAYGIGLPKSSWLKEPLSQMIRKYHESGLIEDLQELYFRRSRCTGDTGDGQLQGTASSMSFDQHAGLYLLLVVGIFVCVLLMFVEHATFKWMVPYWRHKPNKSFWKSISMLFWSQRLYRIITSEELVSPHHSAREMIQVMKDRDFTKLFQKSVKKQEIKARSKKNLFSIVEQLQWKARREERLSQNPSTQTEGSQDSDNSATPVSLNTLDASRIRSLKAALCEVAATSQARDHDSCDNGASSSRRRSECKWTALGDDLAEKRNIPLLKAASATSSFSGPLESCKYGATSDTLDYGGSKSDDELLQSDLEADPLGASNAAACSPASYKLVDLSDQESLEAKASTPCDVSTDMDDGSDDRDSRFSNPTFPLLGRTSSSEDNLLSSCGGDQVYLPNGMVILSPNGDVFARSATTGKNILVRPKTFSNFKNITSNLPESMKTLPLKDNRVKSTLANRGRALARLRDGSITNQLGKVNLDELTKEDLYLMWKTSEQELNRKLKQALRDKAHLEQKLTQMKPGDADT